MFLLCPGVRAGGVRAAGAADVAAGVVPAVARGARAGRPGAAPRAAAGHTRATWQQGTTRNMGEMFLTLTLLGKSVPSFFKLSTPTLNII